MIGTGIEARALWIPLGLCLLGCDAPIVRNAWTATLAFAEPGPLDPTHDQLALRCDDCHATLRGVDADACITCHALDGFLVGRQTTAFHAEARSCGTCHVEHAGPAALLGPLDHDLLASLAASWLANGSVRRRVAAASHSAASLECAACHQNQDPHFELFGSECSECHGTSTWDIADYTHPTPRSRDCAQCHQAPPSHYMKHFTMLSAKVARRPRAEVRECYSCHLTTSWPDIREVGFYKHH